MGSILLSLLLIVIVFKIGCNASNGFGYEVLVEKMECLDKKLAQFQNQTFQQEERRYLEILEQNTKILQLLNKTNQRMAPISSCEDVDKSKRYNLKVLNETFKVYCEQELYGGGWIVIQSRFDGSVDFYRNWTEYRNGFGHLDGESWLGLQKIHLLTSSGDYELLVHLEDFDGTVKHARYQRFAIAGEDEQYKLKTLGSYSGTAGDSLAINRTFSTYDRDNDPFAGNCAITLHGAWWYYGCSHSNLNGIHQNMNDDRGIYWYGFRKYQGLKVSKMMIREV